MGFVEDFLSSVKGEDVEVRNDDDRIDRLNYRWTVVMLVMCAGLVTAQTYIMSERISCWVPAHFKGAWESYVNDYCWIRNTYYLPWDEHVPLDHRTREKYPIVYYQWVPLFLLVQAIFFYFPIVFWRTVNHRTGIDVNDIVETAEKVQEAEDDQLREKWTTFLTRQMDRYLGISKRGGPNESGGKCRKCVSFLFACFMAKRFGNYMTIMYIVVKLLFVANVIGQLFVLNWFLGQNFNMYGIRLIQSWISGEPVGESPYFPRVTFCDVEVRRLGNLHRYTVQCVLPINMFNEKVYAIMWFWFAFVAVLSVFSFLQWLLRVSIGVDSYRYISKRLSSNTPRRYFDRMKRTDRDRVKRFIRDYLRPDGVLVVRLIDYNTNKVTAEDVLSSLYVLYLKKKNLITDDDDDDEEEEDKAPRQPLADDDSLHKQPLPDTPPGSSSSDNMVEPSAPEPETEKSSAV